MHPAILVGAEDIFSEYGIWDCSVWLQNRGFKENYLCATPIRAILDVLYYWIAIKEKCPQPLDDFWEFMFDELDLNELYLKLDVLELTLEQNGVNILKKWRARNDLQQ